MEKYEYEAKEYDWGVHEILTLPTEMVRMSIYDTVRKEKGKYNRCINIVYSEDDYFYLGDSTNIEILLEGNWFTLKTSRFYPMQGCDCPVQIDGYNTVYSLKDIYDLLEEKCTFEFE